MAADMVLQVLVSPLLGTVFNNLSSLIQSELSQVLGVKKELKKLSRKISTIQDVMEDAEDKQLHENNKPLKNWLKRLKDAVYDAEDVLEEFTIEDAMRRDRRSEIIEAAANHNTTCSNNIQVLITDSISCFDFKRVIFRRETAKKIKELREKFDDIAKDRANFHLNVINFEKGVVRRSVETSSFAIEEKVYGRKKDTEELVNRLRINTDDQLVLSVCVIHGMGGIGKTTLARTVYNDEKIEKHFEVRHWVCVSENFDPKIILKTITGSSGEDLNSLQLHLQKILGGKRFLVVLDDVWNDDQAKWDTLKSSLTCGHKGSSVLVTTRLNTVASIMGTVPMVSPKLLSNDDCWSLFEHRAFGVTNNEVNHHPNLKDIGKEIVKKCKGVPLAAKALGGLLRFKRDESQWIHVRDSEIWNLPQHIQDAILPALRLSYNHLPSQLKQCFAYCSIFPKDFQIDKNKLINLWIANGFIQSKGEGMDLEDVGNEIFNDLLWRSLFQDVKKDEFDNIKSCMMHDLVHDLACSIMGDECISIKVGDAFDGRRSSIRHLSFHPNSSKSSVLDKYSLPKNSKHMRTLTMLGFGSVSFSSFKLVSSLHQLIFSNMKLLRILDLSNGDIETVPDSISNLKHLRYLDLSNNNISSLPNKSFSSLRNLQILIIHGCWKLEMLPENLKKMSSLILLDIRGCHSLRRMPVGIGKLNCLESLSRFIVGPETGCGIEELQGLHNLGGELQIEAIGYVRSLTNATKANLMRKRNLTSLGLHWEYSRPPYSFIPMQVMQQQEENNNTTEEEFLIKVGEALQPHPNIKKLHIEGYQGAKFPFWIMGFYSSYLPNLVQISLIGCRRCESLPPLWEVPSLKHLHIAGMDSVKCIGNEYEDDRSCYFPSLEYLEIRDMETLEEWLSPSSSSTSTSTLISFPCLKTLKIVECVKLKSFPPLPSSLQDLRLGKCHEMFLTSSFENIPPSLKSLYIRDFDEWITIFPLEEEEEAGMTMKLRNLTFLKSLYIESCPKLRTLPKMLMENLTALSEFSIEDCEDLVCLAEEGTQYLKSLEYLEISECNSLKSLQEDLLHLTTLKSLTIRYCPQLEFLPGDFQDLLTLQHLTLQMLPKMTTLPTLSSQLQSLSIVNCSSLVALPLWLTDFTSLRSLYIINCENLKVLFPLEGLQRMTALNSLTIRGCHPDLHKDIENYKRDNSHQIAHIHTFINIP